MMEDDILTERIPIMDGPDWGRIEGPGLGVEVDEDKVAKYHEGFLRDGEFTPYGDRFSTREVERAIAPRLHPPGDGICSTERSLQVTFPVSTVPSR